METLAASGFKVPGMSCRFHFGLCIEEPRRYWEAGLGTRIFRQGHGVLRGIRCCQAPPPDACGWCEGQEGKKCRAWGRSPKTRERWDEDGDGWFVDAVEEKDWGHGESHPSPQTTGCDGRRGKFWQEGTCWECEEGREWSRCWAGNHALIRRRQLCHARRGSPRVCGSAEWGGDANRQKGQRSPSPNASCWASLTACGEEAETSSVQEIPAGKAKWGAEHRVELRRLGMEGPLSQSWFQREFYLPDFTSVCCDEVHGPRAQWGRGRCSSSWGCKNLPRRAGGEGHPQAEGPRVHQWSAWGLLVNESQKVEGGQWPWTKGNEFMAASSPRRQRLRPRLLSCGRSMACSSRWSLWLRWQTDMLGCQCSTPRCHTQGWRGTCKFKNGMQHAMLVESVEISGWGPRNHSEAELERSFREAVAWKKKQEKEKKRKAVKPRAKPRKK